MEAKALILKDYPNTTSEHIWECAVCTTSWKTKDTAEQCCSFPSCTSCSRPSYPSREKCTDCLEKEHLARDSEKLSGANKIAYVDYDQPYIFWGGAGPSGEFFSSKLELEDYCVERSMPPPAWVWAVEGVGFLLDAEEVLKVPSVQAGYDIRELVDAAEVEKLQEVLDQWAGECKIKSYIPDYSSAVILDPDFLATVENGSRAQAEDELDTGVDDD